MSFEQSPGTIRNQVGKCLNNIHLNVEQADGIGTLNFTRLLKALAYPILEREPKRHERVRELLAAASEATDFVSGFEACFNAIEEILSVLSKYNLYAFQEISVGDASELAV